MGIRALKHNASAVVARAAAGEVVTVTDRGRAVAQIVPLAQSPVERLRREGRLRPPHTGREGLLAQLDEIPVAREGEGSLSQTLSAMRDEERY